MLFCHKIHNILMINALLSQNLVVEIYALFPPIFLGRQIVSANFFAFWMYVMIMIMIIIIIMRIRTLLLLVLVWLPEPLSPVSNSISAFRPGQTTDDHHGHDSNQPYMDHDSILIMILIIATMPTRTGVFLWEVIP